MSDQDLSKMKVAELRDALKLKGLNTTGNKQELIDRLQAAISDGGSSNHDLDKLEDELLNDDFEEEEEDGKSLLDSTHDLLKSPDSSKSSSSPEEAPQVKKISLKRNISIPTPIIESKTTEEAPSGDGSLTVTSSDGPEKKVVKLSVMSEMERLELRAKKFGKSSTGDATVVASTNVASKDKLEARAARFGVINTQTSSTDATVGAAPSAEILKKRAERFGAISLDVKKTELDEKLQKRKERFGLAAEKEKETVTSKPAATALTGVSAEYAEKARLRLERFKTTTSTA